MKTCYSIKELEDEELMEQCIFELNRLETYRFISDEKGWNTFEEAMTDINSNKIKMTEEEYKALMSIFDEDN